MRISSGMTLRKMTTELRWLNNLSDAEVKARRDQNRDLANQADNMPDYNKYYQKFSIYWDECKRRKIE